ncbi:MAG: FKBP-type peptidyl-prolyl cis-trans isomerase [Bacteroidales bacterium]|nr:FKBP-type peptidyl-prolyl cis-trans isomerase [Bacteroidales bacterium]
MKNLLFLLVVCYVFLSCNNKKELSLKKEQDSLSYAFGVYIASNMKQEALDTIINSDLFIKGFSDVIGNVNPQLTSDQAIKCIQNFYTRIQEKENKATREEGEKFLSENAKKEGIVTLPSGLQYKVIKEGKGKVPKLKDKVKVSYVGKLLNGHVFDSISAEKPLTLEIGDDIIPAWREILQLMPVGSKYQIFVPYQLGYGEKGLPGLIPPFSTIIFEIELLEILKEN